MKKIYVASPFRGDVESNIQKAREYARAIMLEGNLPIVPHIYFTQFLDDNIEYERNMGIFVGLHILEACDELRVYGDTISEGMLREIHYARTKKIDVVYDENFRGEKV